MYLPSMNIEGNVFTRNGPIIKKAINKTTKALAIDQRGRLLLCSNFGCRYSLPSKSNKAKICPASKNNIMTRILKLLIKEVTYAASNR